MSFRFGIHILPGHTKFGKITCQHPVLIYITGGKTCSHRDTYNSRLPLLHGRSQSAGVSIVHYHGRKVKFSRDRLCKRLDILAVVFVIKTCDHPYLAPYNTTIRYRPGPAYAYGFGIKIRGSLFCLT